MASMESHEGGWNPQQRAAVEYPEDSASAILVLAGPGSGKTAVLTGRIGRLMRRGIDAEKILALTFSSAASREMRKRVVDDGANSGSNGPGAGPRISTFHAFGWALLRENTHGDPNWKRAGLGGPPRLSLDSERVDGRDGALGFGDMVPLAAKLLRDSPEIRTVLSRRYSHVLVDEYQDTSPDQLDLLSLLAKEGTQVFAVGDDDQAIYGFRGADRQAVPRFLATYPTAKVVKLEVNYRSTARILRFANTIFHDKPRALRKRMRPGRRTRHGPFSLDARVRFGVHATDRDESKWLCAEARFWKERSSLGWSDIAVLVRTNRLREAYHNALEAILGKDAAEQIAILTVHGAKGLEFPVVFVAGLEDGMFPYRPRGEVIGADRLGEEQRIFFVAVTRAESVLYLTCVRRRAQSGRIRRYRPSPFILDYGSPRQRAAVRWKSLSAGWTADPGD